MVSKLRNVIHSHYDFASILFSLDATDYEINFNESALFISDSSSKSNDKSQNVSSFVVNADSWSISNCA